MLHGFQHVEDRKYHSLSKFFLRTDDANIRGLHYKSDISNGDVIAALGGLNTPLITYDPVARETADGGYDTFTLSSRKHDDSTGLPGLEDSTGLPGLDASRGDISLFFDDLSNYMIEYALLHTVLEHILARKKQ
jgi:hypothetical protein